MYKSKNSRNGERNRLAWLDKAYTRFYLYDSPHDLRPTLRGLLPDATDAQRAAGLAHSLACAKLTYEFMSKHDPAAMKYSLQCKFYLQEKAKGNV